LKENGRHVEMARCVKSDGRGQMRRWETEYMEIERNEAQIASTAARKQR
jgi:hypothetical protein